MVPVLFQCNAWWLGGVARVEKLLYTFYISMHGRKLVGDKTAKFRLLKVAPPQATCQFADNLAMYRHCNLYSSCFGKQEICKIYGLTVSLTKTKGLAVGSALNLLTHPGTFTTHTHACMHAGTHTHARARAYTYLGYGALNNYSRYLYGQIGQTFPIPKRIPYNVTA